MVIKLCKENKFYDKSMPIRSSERSNNLDYFKNWNYGQYKFRLSCQRFLDILLVIKLLINIVQFLEVV